MTDAQKYQDLVHEVGSLTARLEESQSTIESLTNAKNELSNAADKLRHEYREEVDALNAKLQNLKQQLQEVNTT